MSGETPGLSVPLQIPLSKFEKQLARAEASAVKRANNIERKFAESNRRGSQSLTKSAEASAQVFERAIQKETQAFQRLKASVDPAFAAQMRYEAAVKQVQAAVRMGAVSQKEANAVLAQSKAAHLGAASAASMAAAHWSGFYSVSRQGRAVLMNTTNQVSDMFVQFEMGTNVMRIAGQQLPQMLAGFGMLGGALGVLAPLLATVAAIGFPVAAFVMKAGEAAEDSADKVEDFADAFDKAEGSIDRANAAVSRAASGDIDAMRDAYGEVTAEVQNLIETLARLEMQKAVVATHTAMDQFFAENKEVDKLFDALEDRQSMMADLRTEISAMEDQQASAVVFSPDNVRLLDEMRADLEAMERMEGISADFTVDPAAIASIRDARDALREAIESGNMQGMVDAIAAMRASLASIPDGPLADMGDGLAIVEDLLRRAMAQSERLETSAGNINFDAATASASRMADEISRAADAMYDLKAQGITDLETAKIRYEYRDDPVGLAGALAGAKFDQRTRALTERDPLFDNSASIMAERQAFVANAQEVARLNEAARPTRKSGGGGSGGSSKPASPLFANSEAEMESLERQISLFGKSRQEVVALTAKYELLEEAKRRGLDLDTRSAETGRTLREEIDQQAQSIANLTVRAEQYAETADFMAEMTGQLKDGILDAIIEGENFADILKDVAKQLARAALQAALFGEGPMASLFGGTGLVSGLFGSLGLPMHASGTNFAPGGPSIVGEQGPELVNLPRGSKVIPNHKMGQVGGQSKVEVFIHPSGEFDARVEKISGSMAVQVSGQMVAGNNRQYREAQRR